MVSVLHKHLEWKEKKIKCMKLGGHVAHNKKYISKENLYFQNVNKPCWISPHVVLQLCLSFVNFVVKNNKGGGKGRGLLTFFPRKVDLLVRGD